MTSGKSVGVSEAQDGAAVGAEAESATSPLLPTVPSNESRNPLSRLLHLGWNSCTVCGLIAAICLTSSFVALKALSEDVSVFQVSAVRSMMTLPIMMPLGYYQTGMVVGPLDSMKWITARGICAMGAFLLSAISTVFLSLSEAALLMNSYPAIHAFFIWLFGLGSVDAWTWIGIVGAMVAQAIVARPPFLFCGDDDTDWDLERWLGLTCCFASSVVKSLGFIVVGKIDKKIPSIIIASHTIFHVFLVSIPFLIAGCPKKVVWELSLKDALLYLVVALGSANQVFIVRSLQIGPQLKASIVSLSRVLVMVAAGVIFFSEEIKWTHAVGGIMLMASIVLVIYRLQR